MAAVVTMNCTAKMVTIHSTEMTETMCLTVEHALTLFVAAMAKALWNCQEMCSRRIPKIMDRQESGGVMRELL